MVDHNCRGGHGGPPLQLISTTRPLIMSHKLYQIAAVCFLLIVLSLQLFFSVRRESQTWDEANHIFAGYRSWTHGDF